MAQQRQISAGDLEKYSYCPLSWWLSLHYEEETEDQSKGVREHRRLGKTLWEIDASEKSARESETLVFWWAMAATLIALIGLETLPVEQALKISQILDVIALIWVLAASYFLFKASRSSLHGATVEYEKIILTFAIVAAVVAVNAVAFLFTNFRLAWVLEGVAVLWLVGASFFLYRTLKSTEIVESLRKEYRVSGKIEYIDLDESGAMFKSEKHGLTGRPDYVIMVNEQMIPVEEKKGRTPMGPLFSHILQLAAYCLLVEEKTGKAPPYGLLKYPEHEHQIEYNEDLKTLLLGKLAEMRRIIETGEAHRNHERPGKCTRCSRREVCPEKLA